MHSHLIQLNNCWCGFFCCFVQFVYGIALVSIGAGVRVWERERAKFHFARLAVGEIVHELLHLGSVTAFTGLFTLNEPACHIRFKSKDNHFQWKPTTATASAVTFFSTKWSECNLNVKSFATQRNNLPEFNTEREIGRARYLRLEMCNCCLPCRWVGFTSQQPHLANNNGRLLRTPNHR